MKKLTGFLFILVAAVMLMAPAKASATTVTTDANQPGFRTFTLTPGNFKAFYAPKKFVDIDKFGEYDGYYFTFCNKFIKNGYYMIPFDKFYYNDFGIKYTTQQRFKYKAGKKWKKGKVTLRRSSDSMYINGTNVYAQDFAQYFSDDADAYKLGYGKVTKCKVRNVMGSVVFVEPSNIEKVETKTYTTFTNATKYHVYYEITLKTPYVEKYISDEDGKEYKHEISSFFVYPEDADEVNR